MGAGLKHVFNLKKIEAFSGKKMGRQRIKNDVMVFSMIQIGMSWAAPAVIMSLMRFSRFMFAI